MKEFLKTLRLCLKNKKFAWIFFLYHLSYLFINPYRLSRKFLQKMHAKNIYDYGETPLSTFRIIADKMRLSSKDIFLDLGCGRGLLSFWMSSFLQIETIGIDYLPKFIQKARRIKAFSRLTKLVFLNLDFSEADLINATAIYFYGITLDQQTYQRLLKKFEQLSSGVKLVTISAPIESDEFFLQNKFPVTFNWGKTFAYLHVKK